MKVVWIILGIFTLAPVWRAPYWEGGKNLWDALYSQARRPESEFREYHIPVPEAVEECRRAYQQSLQG